MHRCGYTELEIDLFFAKYDISEYQPISEEDMNTILASISSAGMSCKTISFSTHLCLIDKEMHVHNTCC